LIEPFAKFQDSGRTLAARSLVNSSEKVAVRLMKISSQSQTTYKNTVIGLTTSVREILVPEKEGMVNNVMPGENREPS
jgi:hypothetical protein